MVTMTIPGTTLGLLAFILACSRGQSKENSMKTAKPLSPGHAVHKPVKPRPLMQLQTSTPSPIRVLTNASFTIVFDTISFEVTSLVCHMFPHSLPSSALTTPRSPASVLQMTASCIWSVVLGKCDHSANVDPTTLFV